MTKFDERLAILNGLGLVSFENQANIFFKDRNDFQKESPIQGTLHLLRRDIQQCLRGEDPSDSSTMMKFPALWPGTMGILAGIDLLAKHYAGSSVQGKSTERYLNFLSKYFDPLSTADCDTIYQLRNALLHSFGMYSESKRTATEYEFSTVKDTTDLISYGRGRYTIGLDPLNDRFEIAINRYRNDLMSDVGLQPKFFKIFVLYGWVRWNIP